MKKISSLSLLLTALFCLFQVKISTAQGMLREVSLEKQIENSSLVVEGEVVSKQSYWNESNGLIYTANTVEVYKVFKGEPVATIDVITLGGTVGLRALIVNPSLKLYNGDTGVFILRNSKVSKTLTAKTTNKTLSVYSGSQGVYRYNMFNDFAVNPFNKKKGIKNSFYNDIINLTGREYIQIKGFDVRNYSKSSKGILTPASISFSSAAVTAGTKEVLTITGTDFGTAKGKVGFSNADFGGAVFTDALDSQVLTWNETEITVEIPSFAGTGKIRITDGATPIPASAVSATDLTVTYAEINVPHNSGSGVEDYQVQHYDDNGSGGYTWEMYTDFFNDNDYVGAKAAFERAFNNWVCETGVNWTISATPTSTDVIGVDTMDDGNLDGEADPDGVNIIRFDNGTELEDITGNDDILGSCFSWYSICPSTPAKVFVSELDIVFNDDINDPDTPASEAWYFGSDPMGISFNEWDFESVALHELGHGHQLGHVIDNSTPVDNGNDIMHYNLQNFEYQRVIVANNSTAANNIQTRSEESTILCVGVGLMTNSSCPLSVEEDELNNAISVFPNPATNHLFIKNDSFIALEKVIIYDVSGRLISNIDLSNSSKTKTINVVGMAKGVYFVNIHSENTRVTKKIVIE